MEASRAAETLQQGLDDQAKSARGPMDLHNGAWLFISRGAALALLAERDELAKDAARLQGALTAIDEMTYDSWTNGARAQEIARAALTNKD